MEYLAETETMILNRGHRPTFVTSRAQEVLDLTLVSKSLADVIQGWRVDDKESFSDHKYIRYEAHLGFPAPIKIRNRKKTEWELYMTLTESGLKAVGVDEIMDVKEIDARVELVTGTLKTSFESACPEKLMQVRNSTKPYWNPTLTALRQEARRMGRNTHRKGYSYESWVEYGIARREFKKSLRRAKRDSWREYCSNIEKVPQASRAYKMLIGDKVAQLGPIEKVDGTYTATMEETLQLLMETHFPADNARVVETGEEYRPMESTEVETIVTKENIKRAIQSFGSYKSAGTDGIFPAMLQYASKEIIDSLYVIIRACLRFGYVPESWRNSKIVFIPKPGKDSYYRTSSWRPISLTSFLLKLVERLIDWHIRVPQLVRTLRNAGQFAYLRGVSTDAALHQLVSRIERSLKSSEFCLGIFLDIEGAFSHATFKSMDKAMEAFNISKVCHRWVKNMLMNRMAIAETQERE